MSEPKHKFKICLVGDTEVGKSSLLRRFTTSQFSDQYLSTIGMQVSKKEITMPGPHGPTGIALLIYDIMGQSSLRESLKEAYFRGAQGILAVCDVTRRETLRGLEEWISTARSQVGEVPVVVIGNKSDLADRRAVSDDELRSIAARHRATHRDTSAKTGEGVEDSFVTVARAIADRVEAVRA